jgi:hypothetical protein
MTSLAEPERTERITDVRFDDERMYVLLQDGREIAVPLWWYPRLLRATPEQRNNWAILPFGDALHWPDIDEDLDVHGFLIGAKAPDARPPRVSGINPLGKAHADLWRAIQEHGGHPATRKYDQALMSRYSGRIFADASVYANLLELAVEFGSPAVAVTFLLSARRIIVTWLQSRTDRAIEIRHQNTCVTIKGSNDVDKALDVFRQLANKNNA